MFRFALLLIFALPFPLAAADADLIVHNGKVVTVDAKFSIAEAVAVKDGRILYVGSNADALKLKGDKTLVIDAKGKFTRIGLQTNGRRLAESGYASVMQRTQPEGSRSGPGDTDRTLHSLRRFVRLAASGNPS